MRKTVILFYLFGTLGFSAEIIFTALVSLYRMIKGQLPFDLKLEGHSYIWMFFIYGSAAILFPPVYKLIERYPMLIRLLIIALGIFAMEFITGALLHLITGKCPWEYTSRWNICGYIRLDYLPFWMLFAFILEKANLLFERMVDGL
ncbi:MAG: hypothetical protein JWN78_1706 [Bacteroidota bacterium]|nr:hypothetical protein [Bacteroidota bacterium]